MLTLNDIINVSFRKSNFSGYKPEDVDAFLDLVKESYEQLIKKNMEQKEAIIRLQKENDEMVKKIEVLAQSVESYREEEDGIKNALLSAQKLGDASVREARHKAEIILKDASLQAEGLISAAKGEVEQYAKELEDMKRAVSEFRASLLNLYRKHLTLIDARPGQNEEETKAETEAEAKAEVEEPVSDEAPVQEETVVEESVQAETVEEPVEEPAAAVEEPQEETAGFSEESEKNAAGDEEFHLHVESFEPAAEEAIPDRDARFEPIHFEEETPAAQNPDSPVDIFQKNQP